MFIYGENEKLPDEIKSRLVKYDDMDKELKDELTDYMKDAIKRYSEINEPATEKTLIDFCGQLHKRINLLFHKIGIMMEELVEENPEKLNKVIQLIKESEEIDKDFLARISYHIRKQIDRWIEKEGHGSQHKELKNSSGLQ